MGFWCFFKSNILKIVKSKCEPLFYLTSFLQNEVSGLLRQFGDKLEHQSRGEDFPALPWACWVIFGRLHLLLWALAFPICTEVIVPAFPVNQFQLCWQSSGHFICSNCVFKCLASWSLPEILNISKSSCSFGLRRSWCSPEPAQHLAPLIFRGRSRNFAEKVCTWIWLLREEKDLVYFGFRFT